MRFDTWAEFLEHNQQLLAAAKGAVERDIADNRATVYPARADRLRFTETPLRDVRVVILGQDPYFKPGLADGLAFSVRKWVALPPSLRNILRELGDDLGRALFLDLMRQVHEEGRETVHGDLTPWTRQGVLLLNTALTVRRGEAGSHCDIWQPFTDEVIRAVCDSVRCVHFIIWGTKAKAAFERTVGKLHTFALSGHPEREQLVAHDIRRAGLMAKNITATYSAHPSPKSANLGFFGSRPFSRANLALTLNNPGCAPVDWRLS
jgi:uracil-DNA glycosylase